MVNIASETCCRTFLIWFLLFFTDTFHTSVVYGPGIQPFGFRTPSRTPVRELIRFGWTEQDYFINNLNTANCTTQWIEFNCMKHKLKRLSLRHPSAYADNNKLNNKAEEKIKYYSPHIFIFFRINYKIQRVGQIRSGLQEIPKICTSNKNLVVSKILFAMRN